MHLLHGSIPVAGIVRVQQSIIFSLNTGGNATHPKTRVQTMTFVDNIHRFEDALVDRMRDSFEEARRQHKMRKSYRRTYDELNALSERDLTDLGLARADIHDLAKRAAAAEV